MNRRIFITGGTGYIGSRVIPKLLKNNFEVKALTRESSASKLDKACTPVVGNALNGETYAGAVKGCDTFIHLIGVHHPGPGKKDEFRQIDLVSIEQAISVAIKAGVKHFIYLSVAHPAPVMKEFISVRMKGEQMLTDSGLKVSFIRPWYVLGPGHYWPYLIIPFYKVFELIPATRETALRLGLVKLNQIVKCILHAASNAPDKIKIYTVNDIKAADEF